MKILEILPEVYLALLESTSLVYGWIETTKAAMLVSLHADALQVLRTIPSLKRQNY